MILEIVAVGLAMLGPVLGWVVTVERRLSRMNGLKEQVDRVEQQVDRLVAHLLDS